ncbi:MAG TPA: lytic transglycosylase domain-containing protein [Terriglobales bacterium]|nr:lytic transglycosylase domain-containing protein [Terriglobales bacterium]
MKLVVLFALIFAALGTAGQNRNSDERSEAEYYAAAYSQHYQVPVSLVRAVIERESNWRSCAISPKGAAGLMQLMPLTAQRLGVRDRCNIEENISGSVRYLAWLMQQFQGDLRLVLAAYYAGDGIIRKRGLAFRNPEVVAYVSRVRATYMRFNQLPNIDPQLSSKKDMP